MGDLYFYVAKYVDFDEIYGNCDNYITGFVEYKINMKANLIEEGKNLEDIIDKDIAKRLDTRIIINTVIVTSISKLT